MSSFETLVREFRADPEFMRSVRKWHVIPSKDGEYRDFPSTLHPKIIDALRSRGLEQLYSHQFAAYENVTKGKDCLIVTPTASGKTLCYNLPVLDSLLKNGGRALYLFPTKALSQDQQSEVSELILTKDLGISSVTYDGDTPVALRAKARDQAQIIISNMDMLHAGVLPNHPKWIHFFTNIKFIVVDEMHAYGGLFGSHVANVFRRLLRICAFYGSRPQFIACSATIGNPRDLALSLFGRDLELIDKSGAPQGAKNVILYNPPLVDPGQGIRRGTVESARTIAVKLLEKKVKTIVFARSRVRVELIASYIRQSLANHYSQNGGIKIESYRGGYLPNERRAIEKGLRDGSIHGVVSTNALELGIDIGGLDASIIAGFPGSISSVWQQAGRAGRRQSESLSIVIASIKPLDQYLVDNPDYFLDRSPEKAYINPQNPFVFLDHLKCAAFELPFDQTDAFFPEALDGLEYLESEGIVRKAQGRFYWSSQSYPAESISLRSADAQNVVIIDQSEGGAEVIGEIDKRTSKELVHPEAVYIHRGQQYMVHELDLVENRALVRKSSLNYYTDAVVKTDLQVLSEDEFNMGLGCEVVLGDVLVRTQVAKYKKLKFNTNENLGYGEIMLPEDETHTRYIAILAREKSALAKAISEVPEGSLGSVLSRIAKLLRGVAPAFLLCRSEDFGVSSRVRDTHFGCPSIYVHDRSTGGSGLSEAARSELPLILQAVSERLFACACKEGCPSCIGPIDKENDGPESLKPLIKKIVGQWIG